MNIIEVQRRKDWRLFHAVLHRVYHNDPFYIYPLESDIEQVFNPRKNKTHEHGHAVCYVLVDEQGKPAGRIAAFIDHERNSQLEYPVGGIGFFECVKNEAFANALFEKAYQFLDQWEIKAIDGPVNFGERDKFWGLLIKGHDEPLYQENYHPTYYQEFFKRQGFLPYEQILTMHGKIDEVPIRRFSAIAKRARQRYGLYTRQLAESNFKTFAEHFSQVYNVAFCERPHFKPLAADLIYKVFKQVRLVADLKMIAVTYEQDRPIGFAGFLPDINPYLKQVKGRLGIVHIPKLVWQIKTAKKHLLKGIAFGIDPEYQHKGVFAELIDALYNEHTRQRYTDVYLATIRGHNSMMVKSISNLGVKPDRIHMAYRKMLDPTIPFEPFDFLELK